MENYSQKELLNEGIFSFFDNLRRKRYERKKLAAEAEKAKQEARGLKGAAAQKFSSAKLTKAQAALTKAQAKQAKEAAKMVKAEKEADIATRYQQAFGGASFPKIQKNISDEMLKNLSPQELADLKTKIDALVDPNIEPTSAGTAAPVENTPSIAAAQVPAKSVEVNPKRAQAKSAQVSPKRVQAKESLSISQKDLCSLIEEAGDMRKGFSKGVGGIVGGGIGALKGIGKALRDIDPEGVDKLTAPFTGASRLGKTVGSAIGAGAKAGAEMGATPIGSSKFRSRLEKFLRDQGYYLDDYRGTRERGVADISKIDYDKKGKAVKGKSIGQVVYRTENGNLTLVRRPSRN